MYKANAAYEYRLKSDRRKSMKKYLYLSLIVSYIMHALVNDSENHIFVLKRGRNTT